MTDILLGTYNGAEYLPELIESLQGQSDGDFTVWMRDDGSADETRPLLQRLTEEDGRFRLLADREPTGSPSGCFFRLLAASEAPYVMFCDQDDWWHADKVAKTAHAMERAERLYGRDTPLLVHTDLTVVDARRRVLAPSMMTAQQLFPQRDDFPRLLCQSLVSGCTVMINAALRRLVLDHPNDGCLMYDWWLSLCAAAFGRLVYLEEATVDYRQHGDNAVGARDVRSAAYLRSRLREGKEIRAALRATCEQAAAFAEAFGDILPREKLAVTCAYAALPEKGWWERRREVLRLRTLKCGAPRLLGQLWFL